MGEQTSSSISIAASRDRVMAVICDFAAYPVWAKGVQSAEILSHFADGTAETVRFVLDVSPIKDEYTLKYLWNGSSGVTWTLIDGNILKALDGSYSLDSTSESATEVTYCLALEVSIPLIGMLKRKGEKMIIDAALKGLKHRVESLTR